MTTAQIVMLVVSTSVLSSLLTYAVLYEPQSRRIPRIDQKLPKVKIEDLRRAGK